MGAVIGIMIILSIRKQLGEVFGASHNAKVNVKTASRIGCGGVLNIHIPVSYSNQNVKSQASLYVIIIDLRQIFLTTMFINHKLNLHSWILLTERYFKEITSKVIKIIYCHLKCRFKNLNSIWWTYVSKHKWLNLHVYMMYKCFKIYNTVRFSKPLGYWSINITPQESVAYLVSRLLS